MGTSTPSALGRSAPKRPRPTERAALGTPLLLLNLKTYPNCLGNGAVEMATILDGLGRAAGVPTAVAPAAPDLARVAAAVRCPVLAQHVDPVDAGARTGSIPPESLRAAGARGSLLNHSEHPIGGPDVEDACQRLEALGLVAVVCAGTVDRARALAAVAPAYLAVEPPELIGGDRSVSSARPEVVSETVLAVRQVAPQTRVLCGAGVRDRHDVHRAIELGSAGVLVASAVARAADPKAAIAELLAGF
ncbi:MAG: triose-phosphate isomerase [Thermoplasmata archaeon]